MDVSRPAAFSARRIEVTINDVTLYACSVQSSFVHGGR